MGGCFSTSKISGSNSNTPSTSAGNNYNHRKSGTKPPSSATTTSTNTSRKKNQTKENHRNKHQQQQTHKNSQQIKQKDTRRQCGVIPCGKRTDFGYEKDFDKRYTIGKLLGHGQFGYTYVATDKSNGDRVAVKKIDKNKIGHILAVVGKLNNLLLSKCSKAL